MISLPVIMLLLVAAVGTVVVLTREPVRQSVLLSVYGLALTMFFLVMQAPDVALSQLVIGAAVVPLMVLLAIAKARRRQ